MNFIANLSRAPGDPKIIQTGPSSLSSADRFARLLGWFSIGLGVVEMARSRQVTSSLGMRGKESWVRGFGMREIGAGILCLSVDKRVGVWSRVVGDGIDLIALSGGLRRRNPRRQNVKTAMGAVLAITAVDLAVAAALSRKSNGQRCSYRDRSGFPKGLSAAKETGRTLPAVTRQIESPVRSGANGASVERSAVT